MSLSEKSDEEISELLAQYDIKHGPIVVSTRKLYEKKLEKAMEDLVVKPSSDKTYYREEEEEITYITYSPGRHESYGVTLKRRGNVELDDGEEEEEEEEEESDQDTEPPIKITKRAANHSTAAAKSKQPVRKSGGGMWKVIWLLLLVAALAAVLYYAYSPAINKEVNEEPVGVE